MQEPVTRDADAESKHLSRDLFISLILAAVTVALYWPATRFEFNNYDDAQYVTRNPWVQQGLNIDSVYWAFTTGYAGNWHPITWLSHMLDCQLYALAPGGHHFTNLLFHTINTLLLYALLRRLTGNIWRVAFVAALFAWHPLHVESVAWVAERKDVLSTFFALLTLVAYVHYAEEIDSHSQESKASERQPPYEHRSPYIPYVFALFFYALGLLSKPMLVSLPIILLLLDYWPLRRIAQRALPNTGLQAEAATGHSRPNPLRRIGFEKIPFFLLAILSCLITFHVQRSAGAMYLTDLPLAGRIANAVHSYVGYLEKIFWPHHLAVLYPYARNLPWPRVLASGVILLAISALVCWRARRRRHLLVGWLWFLVTLAPVIGLIQVGEQALADRYTYIPAVGLFILVAWEAGQLRASWPRLVWLMAPIAILILAGCLAATTRQLQYWKNSVTLFTHTLEVTTDNAVAHCNLGEALALKGNSQEALIHFNDALRLRPDYVQALNNKASLFNEQGRLDDAIDLFNAVLQQRPDWYLAHKNLGVALLKKGRIDDAIAHFRQAVQNNPADYQALANLAAALAQKGRLDDAITQYQNSLRVAPTALAENGLGGVLQTQGKLDEAARHYRAAIKLRHDFSEARNNLGAILNQQGHYAEAELHLAVAVNVNSNFALAHCNLGNSCLGLGKLADAAVEYSEAIRLDGSLLEAHYNLANLLAHEQQWEAALAHYSETLRLDPDFPDAHANLANVLEHRGDITAAIEHYRTALRLNPQSAIALRKLAWILATQPDPKLRDGSEAVRLATLATQLPGSPDPVAWDTLAAASAETGQFAAATNAASKALELAQAANLTDLSAQIQARLQLYQTGHSYHEAQVESRK